jgi:NAD(P)-dependent dehydrogenase (short-subunit alcohol dehydrogenase family)
VSDVAVVTGAGSGLGAAIAEHLASRELVVVVNTRTNLARAESVVERIRAAGGQAHPVAADVTDDAEVAAMFRAASRIGRLRVLVSNASLRRVQPVEDITAADFSEVLAVTLEGSFTCIRHALPLLADGGRVVNILGSNALSGDAERVHVSAAKHGLLGLTLALARATHQRGITVNAVSPGIDTADSDQLRRCQERIARTVALLTSEEAAHITGTVLDVDCPGA